MKKDSDELEDPVDVGEDDGEQAWAPFREVQYLWRSNEEGRLAYHLWAIKPIVGLDPDECDHDHEPWTWGNDFGLIAEVP